MIRAFVVALLISLSFGLSAHAQQQPPLTLSLIRAVRLSDTSITLSYKTSEASYGKVVYSTADQSTFTLTDSAPQTDHLFTIDELDPGHGYSFALSASAGSQQSDTYTVLLAPESIGVPGSSIMPGVQETDSSGSLISSTAAASSTPVPTESIAPWWVFVLLLILVIGAWTGYTRRFGRKKPSVPPHVPPAPPVPPSYY